MTRHRIAALVLLLGATAAPSARADDKEACVEAYHGAQKLRAANRLLGAREQLIRCAQAPCAKFMTRDCTAWLAEVEARIPSIVPFVKDSSGAEISDATVSMDGTVIARQLDGHAIDVEVGRHEFTFTLAGGERFDLSYVVLEGQKAQRVGVTVPAPPPPRAAGPEPAPPAGAPAPAKPAVVEEPAASRAANVESEWSGRKTLGLVLGGVGIAGLATGGAAGVLAAWSAAAQKNDCASTTSCANRTQAQTDHDSAATAATVSTVALIAGGVFVVTGAVLFATAPGGPRSERAAVEVVPGVAPGSAGMWIRGRF
jgi:hypothetical protein